ncbi:G5 domain-containing protein [Neobacillus fumarioli]|uniref:G5 domain-containing protein n=1 Tax=Neobacillus fumarioli TaxID=105229 RepID=UPI00082F7336|nr:G5 domain-containing protein [Neobacillus fumarioli]
MKEKTQSLKLFFVLILCTAYVFGFSQIGAQAYSFFRGDHSVFPAGTSVASVNIAGETEDEAIKQIDAKIADWMKNTKIVLQYKNKSVPLDTGAFQFHTKTAILNVKPGKKNLVSPNIREDALANALNAFSPDLAKNQVDMQKLKNQIASFAALLHPGNFVIKLDEYAALKPVVINEIKMNPPDIPNDLLFAIGKLKSFEVKGQSTFSLLAYMNQMNMNEVSSDAMSMIASGIYQVILPSNFSILEKHTSQTVPKYTLPGFEAKVDYQKNNDFVFANPNPNSYRIELEWLSDGMHVTLFGPKFTHTYKIDNSTIQYFPPRTIVQYSPIVNPGQIKVQNSGAKGFLIKIYRKEYQNGLLVHNDLISEDFYPPVPKVEIHPLVENGSSADLNQPNQASNGESVNTNSNAVNETNAGDPANTNGDPVNETSNGESANQPNSKNSTSQAQTKNTNTNSSSVSNTKR